MSHLGRCDRCDSDAVAEVSCKGTHCVPFTRCIACGGERAALRSWRRHAAQLGCETPQTRHAAYRPENIP